MAKDVAAVDQTVRQRVQQWRWAPLDRVAQAVSIPGAAGTVFLCALGWVLRTQQPRRRLGPTLLLVCGGAELLDTAVKALVHRPRPKPVQTQFPGQQFAFPSGHATVAAAFYAYVAYHIWQHQGGRRAGKALGAALFPLPVGLARVYLGTHYLTDVLGGYLLGGVWTGSLIIARDVIGPRSQRRRAGHTMRSQAPSEQRQTDLQPPPREEGNQAAGVPPYIQHPGTPPD
jgi:membrane-associated phospholipid phosphatase